MARRKKQTFTYQARSGIKWLSIAMILGILAIGSVLVVGTVSWIQETRQTPEQRSHQQFIEELVPASQSAYEQYGVLPSITLSQAILESNWGESTLSSQYYNLFGIKAGEQEPNVYLETAEYVNETWITIMGRFRVYENWAESVEAHAQLLAYGVDWNPQLYYPVLQAANYQEAARALQTAGYATDPDYANKVIQVIETYRLDAYDHQQREQQ